MWGGRGVGDPKSGVLTLLCMGWGLWVPHKWGLSPCLGWGSVGSPIGVLSPYLGWGSLRPPPFLTFTPGSP